MFRVAVLYLIASWVTLQVGEVGVSLLVVMLLAIGFPVALVVLSWRYQAFLTRLRL